MAKDRQIVEEFDEAVNMTRKELEDWLQTDESQSVGGGESKGYGSSSDDVDHMSHERPLNNVCQG